MVRMLRGAALVAGTSVLFLATLTAQGQRSLTVATIYDPTARVNFSGAPPAPVQWLDASSYLVPQASGGGVEWRRVDAMSGSSTPFLDVARMQQALGTLPGVTTEAAQFAARSPAINFTPDHRGVLVAMDDDLYFYELGSATASRLTSAPGEEETPTFSPDGRQVAFVRANNLYAVDVATRTERQLTSDGSADILNGKLDWLYQEEIFGRGRFRGYWWSPDSTNIAFLQLNEAPVPPYTIVDDIPQQPRIEDTRYPKAGDPNPTVKVGVVRASGSTGGAPAWIDLTSYAGTDILVVNVGWSPDSRNVMNQVQDREQTWLDLNFADAATGRARRVLRETSPAWVDFHEGTNPVWLKNGSFVWFSARNGFKHLYHYQADGTLIRQVTSGTWDVRSLEGIDEDHNGVFFTAGADRNIDTDIYRVGLDGRGMSRLSRTTGTHSPAFNPTFTTYVDTWSDAQTPPQSRLHRADGSEVRVIDANPVPALGEFRLSKYEFVDVPARDGFVMDAMMIKPPDFDPSRRYPVYQFTYAGPYNSVVRNQWGGTQNMFHQLLAQRGVIVWLIDNRSASGKGVQSQWPIYKRLGESELQDLEDGVEWLRKQSYVDASRIILSGWSYGGFMTSYALTHSTSWAAGIAGGPVTNWRNYDTVYTERYMKTPANNTDGYRTSSPTLSADRLHGQLLVIHGAIDDNVHPQNTMQFVYELQRAGKKFELMLYPKSRHGVTDPRLNSHLRQMMLDFVVKTVGSAAVGG